MLATDCLNTNSGQTVETRNNKNDAQFVQSKLLFEYKHMLPITLMSILVFLPYNLLNNLLILMTYGT